MSSSQVLGLAKVSTDVCPMYPVPGERDRSAHHLSRVDRLCPVSSPASIRVCILYVALVDGVVFYSWLWWLGLCLYVALVAGVVLPLISRLKVSLEKSVTGGSGLGTIFFFVLW